MCHYCYKPGHTKRDYRRLQYRRAQYAHVASTPETSEKSVMISVDEYARLTHLQEAMKIQSSLESGKPNTCLVSSSSKWVIDSGATDHMTGNSSLFSNF